MNSASIRGNRIDWAELLPWTIIFRSLTVTCSVSIMVFSLLGVVATPMGWIVAEKLFINSETQLDNNPILAELVEQNRSPYRGIFEASKSNSNKINILDADLSGPRVVFEQLVKPFYAIFGGETTAREFLYFAFGSLWSLVVWSFAGLAITRICLLRFTRNERAGIDDALEYSIGFFSTCFSALAMPIGVAVLLCIPTFLCGLLLGFDFGVLVIGLFWFVVLMCTFLLGLLLLGLMVSWPLVVSSVAAEGQNSFDAVTRAFAYAFQRPVHYFFYAVIALIFGGICWLLVLQFTESVIRLSFWSTAWGANRISANRIETIKNDYNSYNDFFLKSRMINEFQDTGNSSPTSTQFQTTPQNFSVPNLIPTGPPPKKNSSLSFNPQPNASLLSLSEQTATNLQNSMIEARQTAEESAYLKNGRRLIGFWTAFARTIAAAFIHALFWCMASAIYLLLRKDVDQTEMDEIYLVDERRSYDLPPLKSDEHGIPQVQPLPIDEDSEN